MKILALLAPTVSAALVTRFAPRCIRCEAPAVFALADNNGHALPLQSGGFCACCAPAQERDESDLRGPSCGEPAALETIEAAPVPFILGWDDLPAEYFTAAAALNS